MANRLNIIDAYKLSLGYAKNTNIIKNVFFQAKKKDFIFITGKSGSGKTTLLKSFYGDMKPFSGTLSVCGVRMNDITKKKSKLLRRHIGVIFQDYKLIKDWTVEKNISLPLMIRGFSKQAYKLQARKILKHIELSYKADKYPFELSGGEQQRVALGRSLAHNPILLLADEPTGNLDDYSSQIVWNILFEASKYLNMTIIIVTHKIPQSLSIKYRHFFLENGVLSEIS